MGRASVLCVDDNELVLTVTQQLLESSGYSVITAANGKAALAALALSREPFNAVLLDYEMPEMDGGLVASMIRDIQPRLPIILLSGRSDIPRSTLRAVTSVLSKGGSARQLLATLASVIHRLPSDEMQIS